MEKYDRVQHLKQVHQNRKKATQDKAEAAIKALIASNKPINFNSVSKSANLSVTTLYNHPEIKARIEYLRDQAREVKKVKTPSVTDESLNAIIKSLKNKIKKLEEENAELKSFIKNNFKSEYQNL